MTKTCDSCGRAVDESAFQCPACRSSSFDGAEIKKRYLRGEQEKKFVARIKTLEAAQAEMEEIPTQRSTPLFIAAVVLILISLSLPAGRLKNFLLGTGILCLFGAWFYSYIAYQTSFSSRSLARMKKKNHDVI